VERIDERRKQMTNGEKFKSAIERREEYRNYRAYCKKQNLFILDEFDWLELEHKMELKPCPFCGGEATTFKAEERHYVSCVNDDCIASVAMQSFSSEDEAVAAWNRRAK
jgi:Lar family restriction alleviation protein